MAGVDGATSFLVRTNLLGAYHCLEEAARHRAQVLFLSTSRVYPVRALNALAYEESELRFERLEAQALPGASARGGLGALPLAGARTLYGASKLAAELLITEYAESFGRRRSSTAAALSRVHGRWARSTRESSRTGCSHLLPAAALVPRFRGHGKQVRDLLHVGDLAELVDDQLERPDHWAGAVVNVGGGRRRAASRCSRPLAALPRDCRARSRGSDTIPQHAHWGRALSTSRTAALLGTL